MSGSFTRRMYDGCATQQDVKQSTDPLELVLDVNKYVNCNNLCQPTGQRIMNAASLVDVESSLWGLDKISSKCDGYKHPLCGPNGCLLTKDSRVPPHITPYACSRGHVGEKAVVTTNMQMPTNPGFKVPNTNICQSNAPQTTRLLGPIRFQQPQNTSNTQAGNQRPSAPTFQGAQRQSWIF